MIPLLEKIFIWLHNFSYTLLSSLVVRTNDGVHPKHRIMRYHEFFTNQITSTDTVLDIGCGYGAVAHDLSKKAGRVIGIDFSTPNIEKARRRFKNENLEYIIGDATTYKFDTVFDAVVLSNVLEHIEARVDFLKKILPISKKFLIRVPLITRDWLAVYKQEKGMEYRLDPTHYIEYTEEEFKKEIEAAGMNIQSQYVKFGELYAVIEKK